MSDDTEVLHADPSNVDRRGFVKLGALAGATVVLTGSSACALKPPASEGGHSTDPTDFELSEATIQELQAAMASGERSARTITEAYLDRIAAFDRQGPTLRSVIETNPDARDIAEQLDRERAAGRVRGPLHGIPILVKDNVATADRMTTTAGSYALEGSIPSQDSFVAQRLREAGAIILGKANLSEWANIRSNRSSSGWSGRGGQCGNPYSLDRNPCGSSSGSGAATSASFAAAAIGTETNGSVVCPSSANGVVGIKPTVGLVGRSGIIPISHTQDTAGPMARTVADAAAILGALTGVDPRDDVTNTSQGNVHADYTQYLDAGGLQGARIGVARQFFDFNPDVDGLMESAIEAMRQAGATIVDPADIPTRRQMGEPSFQVLLYELKADMAAYLSTLGPSAPVRTLADIIAFNEANADREMPYFGQELFIQAEEKGPLTEPEYLEAVALARRLSREEGIDAVMNEHRLDAIIGPTGGPAWKTDLVNGDNFGGSSSSPAAISGYPNITVPAGFVFGLPVGISFFGRAWSEPTLLRIAYAFEQATQHRQAPGFLPSLELGA
ncbi:MAG: amidase [Gemmatimonadota bacterium]|nr:MAG: amidase [Gemmatimonadota bacterium]